MAGTDDGLPPGDQNPDEADNSSDSSKPEPIEWTMDNEIHLFQAMIGHKPAGINKHFNMIFICEKMSKFLNRPVSSDCIWKYLATLYDLDMLDEIEGIHFPNEQKDFFLPENEYGALMRQKLKESAIKSEEAEDRSISPRVQNTPQSQSRGAAHKVNLSKSSKKEANEKTAKIQNNKDITIINNSSPSETVAVIPKTNKDSNKSDVRRDSKDSSSSSREVTKALNTNIGKSTAKDSKTPKSTRNSVPEKLDESTVKSVDESTPSKKGNKRSTRASLKPEEPTPPSRRRRI